MNDNPNTLVHSRYTLRQAIDVLDRSSVRVVLCIGILVCGMMYILTSTGVSTRGVEISSLERTRSDLNTEIRSLRVDIATARSFQSVEQRLSGRPFVPARDVTYVAASDMAHYALR